ncbi:hypothetical protein H2203_001681 [Taxawa tesnikishii (nom. ined.)]|nr:hypothetical protein H2203_001681 [Dothideales sp. JES 119]
MRRDDVPNSAPCWQEQSDPPSPDIRTDEQATEEDEIAHLLAEKEDLLRQAANVGIQLPQSIASSKSIVLSQSVGLPPMTYGRTNHPNPLASNPGPASPLFNDHPGGHHYRMADEQQPQRTPNWFPTPSIRTQPERATTPNDQATPQQQPHPSAELAARSHDLAGDETARRQAASTPPPMQHPTPRKAAVVLGLMDKSAEDVRSPASVSSQCTSLPPLAPSVWGH